MSQTLVTHFVGAAVRPEEINHYYFGAGALVLLVAAIVALLVFAGGREHS